MMERDFFISYNLKLGLNNFSNIQLLSVQQIVY
jgi:hypothetical protein